VIPLDLADDLLIEALRRGGEVRFRNRSDSMLPHIRPDDLLVAQGIPPGVGDIAVARHRGVWLAHRVVELDGARVRVRADNGGHIDQLDATEVLGTVTEVRRDATSRRAAWRKSLHGAANAARPGPVFWATYRAVDVTARLARGAVVGAGLGLLRRTDLHAIDAATTRRHDAIGRDAYNRSGLFAWERAALERHFPAGGRILLLAAGGGREVLALRQLGYAVQAYECLPELVAGANRLLTAEGLAPDVRHLPRDETPPRDPSAPPFDGAIVGWGAYTLVRGRRARVALLRGLGAHLAPGGPILLSFFFRTDASRYLRAVHRIAAALRRGLGAEPPDLGDDLQPHFVHLFTAEQVAEEVGEAGLGLGELNGYPYGHAVAIRPA
jgi:hypothetical protein